MVGSNSVTNSLWISMHSNIFGLVCFSIAWRFTKIVCCRHIFHRNCPSLFILCSNSIVKEIYSFPSNLVDGYNHVDRQLQLFQHPLHRPMRQFVWRFVDQIQTEWWWISYIQMVLRFQLFLKQSQWLYFSFQDQTSFQYGCIYWHILFVQYVSTGHYC